MDRSIIDTLSRHAPPPRRWRYASAQAAASRIAELETLLRLPRGQFIANVRQANERVSALEQMLVAVATPVPVTVAAAPATNAPPITGRERTIAATRIAGRRARPVPAGVTGRDRMKAAMQIETHT